MTNPLRTFKNNLNNAVDEQKKWVKANPKAGALKRMKRSVKSVHDSMGMEFEPTPGKMLSIFVPVPVSDARKIDKKVAKWDQQVTEKVKRYTRK